MSVTMEQYDPIWCDGHYCPKDCEQCEYREENRDNAESDFSETDVTESRYAEWLEGTIKTIMTLNPDTMGLVAVRDSDGMALTSYFDAGARDKAEFVHHILSDYIMEIIENNASHIRNMIIDSENDDDGDGDDEIE